MPKKAFKSFENFIGDSGADEKEEDDPEYFSVKKNKSESPDSNQAVTKEVHYFKHVQDVVWEDHKPPTSRGDQTLNYLRTSYMVKLMMKYAKQPKV